MRRRNHKLIIEIKYQWSRFFRHAMGRDKIENFMTPGKHDGKKGTRRANR